MYDMYPEWGPAKNRDDERPYGVQASFDRWDTASPRPDDN